MRNSILSTLISSFLLLPYLVLAQMDQSTKFSYLEAMEKHDYAEAVAISQEALLKDSQDVSIRTQLAKAAFLEGKLSLAEKELMTVFETDSTYIPSRYQYAKILAATGRNEAALQEYEILMNLDTIYGLYAFLAAETALEIGDFNRAVLYHQISLEMNPKKLDSYVALSRILIDVGAFGEADSLLELASELDFGAEKCLLFKAKSAFLQDDFKRVNSLFDTIPELGNLQEAAYRYYGISLYREDRFGEALKVLTELNNINDELDYPHYYKGLCFMKMGETSYAEVQFRQAVLKAQSPNLSAYYQQMAKAQQIQGNHAEAIKNFKLARHFDNNASLAYDIALSFDAYYEDKSVAMRAFEEFLELGDTMASLERNYAQSRVESIKKERHFENVE